MTILRGAPSALRRDGFAFVPEVGRTRVLGAPPISPPAMHAHAAPAPQSLNEKPVVRPTD